MGGERFAAFNLRQFLVESNRIEGIRGVRHGLLLQAEHFLGLGKISRQDLIDFVAVAQPNAAIRDQAHLNVRVGNHFPPRGGPEIVEQLDAILDLANCGSYPPYHAHVMYETLHPFTDGNGRSGRILWLWMMGGIERAPLGFLHHWYYQSLAASRVPDVPSPSPSLPREGSRADQG